jgi:hypothetical protein
MNGVLEQAPRKPAARAARTRLVVFPGYRCVFLMTVAFYHEPAQAVNKNRVSTRDVTGA